FSAAQERAEKLQLRGDIARKLAWNERIVVRECGGGGKKPRHVTKVTQHIRAARRNASPQFRRPNCVPVPSIVRRARSCARTSFARESGGYFPRGSGTHPHPLQSAPPAAA